MIDALRESGISMNAIENVIFQFISQWYDSFDNDNLFVSEKGRQYQIIQPSGILESCWYSRDAWGNDWFEALDELSNEQLATEDIIDSMTRYTAFSKISEIRENGYYIRSIIELSTVVPVNSLQYVMIEYTKRKNKKIKICNYKCRVKYVDDFGLEDCMDEWDPILVDEDYKEYLRKVNNWVDSNSSKPADDKCSCFFECKYEDLPFFFEHLRPELLDKSLLSSRKQLQVYLKSGKARKLGELATLIYPKEVSTDKSFYINNTLVSAVMPRGIGADVSEEDKEREIDIADHKTVYTSSCRTDTRLHKGDYYISTPYVFTWCPILEEPTVPVYASSSSCVIRLKKGISLEYLFLYFETDVGKIAVDILSTKNSISYLPDENIELIQIVLPQKDSLYYRDMVKTLYFNNYHSVKNHLTYRQQDELFEYNSDEDLLQIKKFQLANLGRHTNLRRMILLDIEEVYRCIKAEAYKAAIILCGSILEAVLIDWVSEIDNVDYFGEKLYDRQKRLTVYGSDRKCFRDKNGRATNIDLFKLIDRIDGLKPPVWIHEEAQFATIIRERRNKVHAGLAISNPVITKQECELVLDYLIRVLDTRGLIV